ncbi:MAG TPA: putative Fe-S cluster assembly protein SufT [Candidatus Angelobacter sp.]
MNPEVITLTRSCESMEIPSGISHTLPSGTRVRVMQKLGGSYTVMGLDVGGMYRIDPKDADALGFAPASAEQTPAAAQGELTDEMIWKELKTVYDPEIPVNIADLGLIYSCVVQPHEKGGKLIDIKMSMTAPGCGMGGVLKADVERKLSRLPEVTEVRVEIVFEPQWHPGRMSEAARLQLGIDMDYYNPASSPRY